MANSGTLGSSAGISEHGSLGNPDLQLGKGIKLNLTEEDLEMVDTLNPYVSMKALVEF